MGLAADEQSYMKVNFADNEDCKFNFVYYFWHLTLYLVLQVAHCILFEKTLSVNGKRLFMMIHKQHGNYNAETSIHVG